MRKSISIYFIFLFSITFIFAGDFFKSVTDGNVSESKPMFSISADDEQKKLTRELDVILSVTSQLPTTNQNIVLKTKDGLKRDGVLTIRKFARGNVVLCHPAAYDKDFMIPFQEKVFAQYNCLRFDFRRHGKQKKRQYSTLGKKEVYEVQAAANFFKNDIRTKDLPLYGFGISLGAVSLIESESQQHQFNALIVQAPFDSLKNKLNVRFPFLNEHF